MSLFVELKRRNVFRVAAAYAVLSWLLLQVGDVLFESLELPNTWNKGLIAVLLLGIIPTVFFSWVYELTPEGIKKESEVDRSESITHHTGRKLDIAVIVLAVVAIGLFGLDRAGVFGERASSDRSAENPSVGFEGDRAASRSVPSGSPADEEAVAEAGSGVAILPFDNLSTSEENAFFASGIHEDILTYLSRAQDLRVISRTSVEKYAESDLAMGEIARELGVSHIVEGSVRRAGDRVRVTVQLIEAASDRHLWADNYDRTLDDVFAIQTEIANAIVGQLKAQLSGDAEAEFARLRTTNMDAYDLYLQARAIGRENQRGYAEQIEVLRNALALDPSFVAAWILLGEACGWEVWFYNDPDGDNLRCAEEAVARVEALAPGTPEAAAAKGHFLYQVKKDFRGTLAMLEPIAPERPNDAQITKRIALAHYHLTHWTEALERVQRAILLDPNDQNTHLIRYLIQYQSGDLDAARTTIDALVERFPENSDFAFRRAQRQIDVGRIDVATDWALEIAASPAGGSPFILLNAADILSLTGQYEQALGLLEQLPGNENTLTSWIREFQKGRIFRAQENGLAARDAYEAAYRILLSITADRPQQDPQALGWLAWNAAILDDHRAFEGYRDLALRVMEESQDVLVRPGVRFTLALGQAELGEVEAAWQRIETLLESPIAATPWRMKLDPDVRRLFGHLPEYQELVADLEPAS